MVNSYVGNNFDSSATTISCIAIIPNLIVDSLCFLSNIYLFVWYTNSTVLIIIATNVPIATPTIPYFHTSIKDIKILEKPVSTYVRKDKIVEEKVDEAVLRREKMLIYIIVTYPEESLKKIKDVITVDLIKLDRNKQIIKKLYEELEKGNSNNVLDYFTDPEIINYLSGIMAYDFEITDINKCVEDLINIYTKEKLVNMRNIIIKQLDDTKNLTKEEIVDLEKKLNDVILKLAKIK